MCFDLDSRPPIAPIAGGAYDQARLILEARDRNRLAAFRARAAEPSGAAIAILQPWAKRSFAPDGGGGRGVH